MKLNNEVRKFGKGLLLMVMAGGSGCAGLSALGNRNYSLDISECKLNKMYTMSDMDRDGKKDHFLIIPFVTTDPNLTMGDPVIGEGYATFLKLSAGNTYVKFRDNKPKKITRKVVMGDSLDINIE